MFFGIDLTSRETKPSACLCLNDKLEVVYCGLLKTDSDIVSKVGQYSPRIIAIDAPLSLPVGLCCLEESCGCQPKSQWKGRLCERELAHVQIYCYFTTKKSIIKDMVERAIKLKEKLGRCGREVIEVYPYASKVRLFGKPIPRKSTAKGRFWLREKLSALLKNRQPFLEQWNHDLCDAAIAAYTGFLYTQGKTEALGDVQEGLIYIPTSSCGHRESGLVGWLLRR
jgi:predicted nuclease with RNAse H fold